MYTYFSPFLVGKVLSLSGPESEQITDEMSIAVGQTVTAILA